MRPPVSAYLSALAGLLFAAVVTVNPVSVSAHVTVNEFSSYASADWIELQNTATESADLTGLRLKDGSASNKKDLSGVLYPGAYLVIPFSNYLNRTGDTVFLVDVSGGNEQILEQVSYGGDSAVCPPDEGQTLGRQPDGSGQFVRLQPETAGADNTAAAVVPCPSVSPTPAPTVRSETVPTRMPSAAPTPAVATVTQGKAMDVPAGAVAGASDAVRAETTPLPSPPDGETAAVSVSVPSEAADQARDSITADYFNVWSVAAVRILAAAAVAAGAGSLYTTLRTVRYRL